jgi:Fe-S cluster assembly protein SufD
VTELIERPRSPLEQALLPELAPELEQNLPSWLVLRRSVAGGAFRAEGLPGPKDEAWRFTRLRTLSELSPSAPPGARDTAWVERELARKAHAILLDGVAIVPDGAPLPGVRLLTLAEALREQPSLLEQAFGTASTAESRFSALNTALFSDVLVARIAENAAPSEPLCVAVAASASSSSTLSHPRLLVVAAPNSSLVLVETYLFGQGSNMQNAVTELCLEQGAAVDHMRIVQGTAESRLVGELAVRQARSSRYTSRVFTLGGALSRLDLAVWLDEEGAECSLDGLYMARGEEQVDHHTRVEHVKPNTTSIERYKGIVAERGSAVFDGIIHVERGAMKASAHQENRNVLLSDEAIVNTKPHLEIDADDVSCTHGATVGKLDESALFYLRARGLDEDAAQAVLLFAFVREILDRVPISGERERLSSLILDRMGRTDLLEELLA